MNQRALMALGVLTAAAAWAAPAVAQDVTAEVRTWGGQTWTLARPSLQVFYTILPKSDKEEAEPPAGPRTTALVFELRGRQSEPKRPEPLKAQEQVDVLRVSRQGVMMQVPLDRITGLAFSRQPVPSPFLPTMLPVLYRHAVTVALTDGSRVEADHVSLGTTVLRGVTPQGRVDIPWDEIETVRFRR
ncbi:MAG: hypothetical protein ACREMB_12760 [Candidatus Rokuibacteriota bacterium]